VEWGERRYKATVRLSPHDARRRRCSRACCRSPSRRPGCLEHGAAHATITLRRHSRSAMRRNLTAYIFESTLYLFIGLTTCRMHAACRRVYSYSTYRSYTIYYINMLFRFTSSTSQRGIVKIINFTRITTVEIVVIILQKLPPSVLQSLSTSHQRWPTACSDPRRARDTGPERALQ
jgi:hypothetical protein